MFMGQMKFIGMTCWTPYFGVLTELLAKHKVPLYWYYTIHHMFYFFRDVLLSHISASTSLWNLYYWQFTINQSLLTEAFIRETRGNKYLSV